MSRLEDIQEKLNANGKGLWVFKYRDGNNNHANSIVFITNIQLPDVSAQEFMQEYSLTATEKGEMTREMFSHFNRKRFKLRKI
jgi:5-methylcytosine-specific restriction endonuclease McrBC GTP-binding regulatory subunit McrB